jgi:glycosyltransferase involved in cell wall biosynthesis
MRIAYIGQKGIPTKLGGVERYVEEVAVRMAKRGHQVFVYVRNNYTDKDLKKYRGVTLIHLPSISTKNLDAISHTFLSTIHALFGKYDVIHFNSIGPTSLSFLVKLFGRKIVVISTFQCQDYMHKKWGWFAKKYLYFSEFITCKIPDKTIVVSKSLLKYVKNKYNKNAEYIPNGAETRFNENSDRLKEWKLEKGGYILAVSRFIRHKGLQYLIEAYRSLENKGMTRGKKLVIIGDGFHTDDYVDYIKDLAQGSKNIVLTGARTGNDLDQLFSHSYLFVQPSESEGLSLALLEAMGYRKAVLVSNIEENLEAIGGKYGIFFENKNSEDLEQKLVSMINDPVGVKALGEKAREFCRKKYSWDAIVEKIEKLYKELIKVHG